MKQKYRFLSFQFNEIIRSSIKSAKHNGREICGLLIDNGYFLEILETVNKTKKGGGFSFYANEIRQIQKSVTLIGNEIVGTFHSHPCYIDEPSKGDIRNTPDDSLMMIIDVTEKNVGLWHIKNLKKKRLKYVVLK